MKREYLVTTFIANIATKFLIPSILQFYLNIISIHFYKSGHLECS